MQVLFKSSAPSSALGASRVLRNTTSLLSLFGIGGSDE